MNRYTQNPKRISQNREGASAVEFALVLPLIFTLIFMMCEASRFLMGLHAATGAAREGARIYAVTRNLGTARTAAENFLTNSSFDTSDVKVGVEESNSNIEDRELISCTVEIAYADVSLIGDPFNLNTLTVPGFATIMADED